MPTFSKRSLDQLATCDHHIQVLFNEVIKYRDCVVVCGHRGKAEQDAAVASGASKTPFPDSTHNSTPSNGVDVYPYIDGKMVADASECRVFGGFVLGMAAAMNLGKRIRWGGDWDGDGSVKDQTFNDLVHFEYKG
jgi:peptidoglycan L-alanyl-D-glutamate endopeptidase CwlK